MTTADCGDKISGIFEDVFKLFNKFVLCPKEEENKPSKLSTKKTN
jgi:hypothetical protein